MTPLEIAGRAVADEWTRIFPGSRPTEEHRIRLARAALLALAECELPQAVTQAGMDAATDSDSGEDIQPTDRAFRAMLRSLKGETND